MGSANLCINRHDTTIEVAYRPRMSDSKIEEVERTWEKIREFDPIKIGIILFERIFLLEPETFDMFDDFKKDPNWKESKDFRLHCTIFMTMVGKTIRLLKRQDELFTILDYLGLKHAFFKITQNHFDVMGIQLGLILKECLGPDIITESVFNSWSSYYEIISSGIISSMKSKTDFE